MAAIVGFIMASGHAVITGGTGGIGRALAYALARAGWSVAAPGRRELDVTDPAAIAGFFDNRQVDLLVCAAGITRDAPLLRLSEGAWDDVWAVNYQGAVACAEAVLPGMRTRGGGHVVVISSFSALHPPVGQSAYAAAKAALLGWVAATAAAEGAANIRVNAILPGFLATRMTEAVTGSRRAEVLAEHALGRLNTCEAVAGFIQFLHDGLPHTSGQVFQLDSRRA